MPPDPETHAVVTRQPVPGGDPEIALHDRGPAPESWWPAGHQQRQASETAGSRARPPARPTQAMANPNNHARIFIPCPIDLHPFPGPAASSQRTVARASGLSSARPHLESPPMTPCPSPRHRRLPARVLAAGHRRAQRNASYELDPVHTRVMFAVEHAGFSKAIGTVSGSSGDAGIRSGRLDHGHARSQRSAAAPGPGRREMEQGRAGRQPARRGGIPDRHLRFHRGSNPSTPGTPLSTAR